MTDPKLLAQIRSGSVPAVLLLYGNEHGPMREVVQALRETVVDDAMAAFNHERFIGRDLEDVGPVLAACAQMPMMAARRLIELDEPEAIGKGRGAADPKLLEPLIEYIGQPNETTVLVITSTGIDGRARLVSSAKKSGVVEKFEGLKNRDDAIRYVREHSAAQGVHLDAQAAAALVDRCGTSPSVLATAIEQVGLYAGEAATVHTQDVAEVVADTREAVIFDLTDAVGLGRHEQALTVFRRMLSQGGGVGESMAVVAMLARALRLLMLTHAVGGSAKTLETHVPPFVARKLVEQARRFSMARLRHSFAQLVILDADLKGGSYAAARSPATAVERWILDACQALPGVAPRGGLEHIS